MREISPKLWALLVMLLSTAAAYGQQAIPQIAGTSLSGHAISLPRDLPVGLSVLVVGFTKASGDGSKQWGHTLATTSQTSPGFAYFQTPVMQSIPRFIRGMVLGSIRKDIPASQLDRFLPVFDHEKEWKQLVSYSAVDDAYILVVNQQGIVRWQTHGPPTPERVAALRQAVSQ